MANCKHCGSEIKWKQNAAGGWIPGNQDGSDHRCLKNNAATPTPAATAAPTPTPQPSVNDTKPCRFCNGGIVWKNLDGRWIPHNGDGSKHMCNRGKQ